MRATTLRPIAHRTICALRAAARRLAPACFFCICFTSPPVFVVHRIAEYELGRAAGKEETRFDRWDSPALPRPNRMTRHTVKRRGARVTTYGWARIGSLQCGRK